MIKRILILLVFPTIFIRCEEDIFEGIPRDRVNIPVVDFDQQRSNIKLVNGRVYWKNTLQFFLLKKSFMIGNKKVTDTMTLVDGRVHNDRITGFIQYTDSLTQINDEFIHYNIHESSFNHYLVGEVPPYYIDDEMGILPYSLDGWESGKKELVHEFITGENSYGSDPLTRIGFLIEESNKKKIKVHLIGDFIGFFDKVGEVIINPSSNELLIYKIEQPTFQNQKEKDKIRDEYSKTDRIKGLDRKNYHKNFLKLKVKSKFSKSIRKFNREGSLSSKIIKKGEVLFSLDGDYISYHDNGKVKIFSKFKDGVLNGEFKRYNSKGEIELQGDFINDTPIGVFKKFSNGERYDTCLKFLETIGYKVKDLFTCYKSDEDGTWDLNYSGGSEIEYRGIVEEDFNGKKSNYIFSLRSDNLKTGEYIITDFNTIEYTSSRYSNVYFRGCK